ncbi:hypothetical protein [Parasitella parasitica]|uniref:CAP-Gly domain-containing protein n=1 Tax=Parasitella parasitica TaxID=35722 RepID=A0A0B7NGL1_9FUNG|nr:hypothetical protein [Parasitella parasitica]
MSHLSYQHHHYSGANSKIARPSSITMPTSTTQSIQTATNNNSKKKQIKQPDSRLSKSHSMHRLLLQDDEAEKPMHRRALLSRATTTPVPRPSSLIKRFSDHTAMKRCSSLMNPPLQQSLSNTTTDDSDSSHGSGGGSSGDLVSNKHDFRLGQRVCVPSLNVVGTVKYFGETKFKEKGVWVGIELDLLGTGKNDGSIQGVRYFSCAPNTGLFVLAAKVAALEDSSPKKKIIPRTSKTTTIATAATKKSQSASTKRKSMIITSSTTTTTSSSSTSTTTTTTRQTTIPKRHRSATTTNPPMNPSKSARTVSTLSSNSPLPTRSTPSGALKKTPTSTKTSKPALKKSSSMSTSSSDCHHHHHHNRPSQQQDKQNSANIELERMHALLEKSIQEKQALSQQMNGQEAAWERLVSAKESYAVRVQEKDDEIARLKRLLENSSQATHELAKITSERDSALSRASMSEAMEKQHSKVIERLDVRVRTLQQQLEIEQRSHETTERDYTAKMDQIRKQLTERDKAAAVVERECSELRQEHVKAIKAFEATVERREREYTTTLANKDAHIAKLQHMVNDLMYPSTASPITEDDSTRRRLEAQLELTTSELDKERELIKAQALDISQLKDEIKRLHRVSVCSSSDFYQIRSELEHEIDDKRRIMEEANAALEVQAKLEEENERIKLTYEKTQRDLADVLRKLATTEKERGSADLLAKCSQLEADNERLHLQQKQAEHECMRLMDELLAIEKVESVAASEHGHDDKMYRREIEQLKLQVNREIRRYQDLEQAKEAKIRKLYKELSDLESLVENKVFNETELEEAIECEKRKVRMLEGRLREEEEKNRRLPIHAPLSPTSPQYSLFHRQHHHQQPKRSSTGSFSLMTSSSIDTVSDHGNLLESVYCEICEEYGHEVLTCNAYKQKAITDNEDDYYGRSLYCVNCDVFDTHSTDDCPNQDETF